MEPVKKGPPPRPSWKLILNCALGGAVAIGVLAFGGTVGPVALLMAPFGSSCVLLFCAPESPLSQPRAVVAGHVLSVAVGLAVMTVLGNGPLAMAVATGLAIAVMMATRTLHAPAGADPALVMLTGQGWGFLLMPVLPGVVLLVLVAVLWHRLTRRAAYPNYWW